MSGSFFAVLFHCGSQTKQLSVTPQSPCTLDLIYAKFFGFFFFFEEAVWAAFSLVVVVLEVFPGPG